MTDDGFDPVPYGGAVADPNAPFGTVASMPAAPEPNMSVDPGMSAKPWLPGPTPGGPPPQAPPEVPAGGMSQMPPEQSGGMSRAPQVLQPVDVVAEPQPQAQPVDLNQLDPITLGAMGLVRQGGQAAREYRPAGYVNAQRTGAFDPSQAIAVGNLGFEAQRDAAWNTAGAQLLANDAEVEAARAREAQVEQMRQEAAAKERAVKAQLDRDRAEYEGIKREYRDARDNETMGAFGTVPGALSTIFGMLAIGLAARGSRENLNATVNAVQSNVDRQVQNMRAQTAARGQDADNAYARYLKAYGNAEQAEAATKALLNERMMTEIDRMALESKDPLIQANAAQTVAQLSAEFNRYQGDLLNESQGKATQLWQLEQQARRGTAGGLRQMTLKEQLDYAKATGDIRGQNLQNEKTVAETGKLMNSLQGGASSEDLKDFAPQLKERRAANEALSKSLKAIEAIEAKGEGDNFAGLDDSSFTPVTAAITGGIERKLSAEAAREMNELDGIIDAKTLEAFGSSTPEQRQTVADRILGDGSKQGVLANLKREAEASRQKIREIDASIPAGVQNVGDARRQVTGASRATVAQPGRVIPTGR